MKLKYVIFDNLYPVVFGEYAQHSEVKIKFRTPTSAGFVQLREEDAPANSRFCSARITTASCYGESISLNLKSDPKDERVIENLFNE
jgi:hypothetical protein